MSVFSGLPDVFVSTFGEAVTIIPVGGDARQITGVLRRESDRGVGFDGGGLTHEVRLHARAADVHDVDDGAAVSAGGVDYLAGAPAFDGRGMASITLRLA